MYIRTVTLLSTTSPINFKLVYGPFGQSNMHSTLDFCLNPVRKERNVPVKKKDKSLCPNVYPVFIQKFYQEI